MPALSLSHYNLRGTPQQLLELAQFYQRYVGLQDGPRPPLSNAGYWLYAGDQAALHLSPNRAGESRQSALKSSFDHTAFHCSERAAMCARLSQDGIVWRAAEIAASPGFATQWQVFFSDPLGNGIELNFAADD